MAKIKQKNQSQILRRQGHSISEISKLVGVSKSTASYWCKDIVLTQKQIEKIFNTTKEKSICALIKYQEISRLNRQSKISKLAIEGKEKVGELTARDLYILGLGLYWAEGYKKGNDELGFTNMDPLVIKTLIFWLRDNYKIDDSRFVFRVSINIQHKHRDKEVIKYWSDQLKMPVDQFTKTSFVKTKIAKQYSNWIEHFGTLRVKVRKATDLRREILGSIQALSEKFGH